MNMYAINMNRLLMFLFGCTLCLLTASCGGGGSTVGGGGSTTTGTIINGTVGKGPFYSGYVECFYVTGSTKGPVYKTVPISGNGAYTLDLEDKTGLVLLEAYGTYLDEFTNKPCTIAKPGNPLRAAFYLQSPGAPRNVAVTPLTELAVRNAYDRSDSGKLSRENLEAAYSLVSDIFTFDINEIQPSAPDSNLSGKTAAQQRCTLINGGISARAPTPSQLDTLLDSYATDLATPPNRISSANITDLNDGIKEFLDSDNNKTGFSHEQAQQIALFSQIGFYTTLVTVSTSKNSPSAAAEANLLQFALELDPNLDVENSNGIPLEGIISFFPVSSSTRSAVSLFTSASTGKRILNIAITNSSTPLTTGNLATIRIKTDPAFNPGPTSIVVKHLFQNDAENITIPFAAKDDANTTAVDWKINVTY